MIFFTSILSNYLDKSLALAESVLKRHQNCEFRIYVFDYESSFLPEEAELKKYLRLGKNSNLPTFHPAKQSCPKHLYLERRFNIIECCTAVKPFIFLELLHDNQTVVYLDPDTFVYAELDLLAAEESADQWDLLLIPHVLQPANRSSLISERLFSNFGVFNLGFLAAKSTPDSLKFLEWWAITCGLFGVARPTAGLYVDQKIIDFAPAFIDNLKIIRHPGWNVAWWNIFCDGRKLREDYMIEFDGKISKLVFMHFSNLDVGKNDLFVARPLKHLLQKEHHQKARLEQNPAYFKLLGEYKQRTAEISNSFYMGSNISINGSKRFRLSQRLLDESFRGALQSSRLHEWTKLTNKIGSSASNTIKLLQAIKAYLAFSGKGCFSTSNNLKRSLEHFEYSFLNPSLWNFDHASLKNIDNIFINKRRSD